MQIAIVGIAGRGTAIAQLIALGGDELILHDTNAQRPRLALGRISRALDAAVLSGRLPALEARRAKRRFTITTDLNRCAGADLIIENVADEMKVKETLFQTLDDIVRPDAMLATTTNQLSLTALAAATKIPRRVIGLHFFDPLPERELVEVVRSPQAEQILIDRAVALMRRVGKSPVVVQDSPGLIVNRITQAYFGEALHLLDDAKLDAPTVDRLMEGIGFPQGPFRLLDALGLDQTLGVVQAMWESTYHAAAYRPHPRHERMVRAGQLGEKSEAGGFYPKG